jgi:hypothetical protein
MITDWFQIMTLTKTSDEVKPPNQDPAKKLVTIDLEICPSVRVVGGIEFKFHSPYAMRSEAERIAKQLKENGSISAYRIMKRITVYCLYIHQ